MNSEYKPDIVQLDIDSILVLITWSQTQKRNKGWLTYDFLTCYWENEQIKQSL